MGNLDFQAQVRIQITNQVSIAAVCLKITYFLSIGGRLHISQDENFLICSSYGLVASSFVQILLSLKCSSVFASKALNDVSINHFLMDKILQRSHFKWFECWQHYYIAIFINNLQKSQNSR